jgi:hypothetical protein
MKNVVGLLLIGLVVTGCQKKPRRRLEPECRGFQYKQRR